MKILQIKIEYVTFEEFERDKVFKFSEFFEISKVTQKKDGKIVVLWTR